ncbi:MAG: VWA domain-containing protein [Gammaproteobacteria bacterium]|nr:VWA domain-containing protein [Gammaproteobacteria bacterium]
MWKKTGMIPQQHFFRKTSVFASILICAAFLSLSISNVIAKSTITPEKASVPIKDIRILIDISGSMKKTDPNNFRRPAVKLFASLLPEDIFSGVWTFGKWVNMLVPHGIADSKWKAVVHEQTSNINSTGLFTNIEEALRRATWDWKEYNPHYERTIIILSDGVVDISNNPEENNDSRSRILKDILTTLSDTKVTIHTIALSSLSDKDLLQQLSFATGGIHETIETTEDLDKTFMRIFDAATPRDELPLTNNKVKVDNSIKEITFLTFRKDKSSNTTIISPSGKKYSHKKENDDVTWHSENRYDLVTIKTPETGTWRIDAAIDPDNRVMVVTDLRLITTNLPDNILAKDTISLYAHLESEQKIIKRRDFLHFVRMAVKHSDETGNSRYSIKLKDDGKGIDEHKRDGIYSAEIKKANIPGKHTFELLVNGTTFKRRNTQTINIVKYPAIIDINVTSNNDIAVSIIPYQTLIDTESMKITAIHSLSGDNDEKYFIEKTSPAEWKTIIPTNTVTGNHTITIKVVGNNKHGETIIFTTEPKNISIGDNNPVKTDHLETTIVEENNDIIENESTSWLNVILSMLGFNLVFILSTFSLYKLWVKYRYKLLPIPCEEMSNA